MQTLPKPFVASNIVYHDTITRARLLVSVCCNTTVSLTFLGVHNPDHNTYNIPTG